jgi:hypothetical protein
MKLFLLIFLILTFAGPAWLIATGKIDFKADYRTAICNSTGMSPSPRVFRDAIIQVYSARAFNWRGAFGTHTWISVKPKDAQNYIVYQVVGWRLYSNLPALMAEEDLPDRYWYGQRPELLLDIRGEKAEKLIPKIAQAANSYPYPSIYTLWPGPNSNTFPAYVAREVPELRLALPANAIGKDLLPENTFFAHAPSGTGYQICFHGLFGIMIALKEGIEINLLGLTYGIKFWPPAILLPGIGQINLIPS